MVQFSEPQPINLQFMRVSARSGLYVLGVFSNLEDTTQMLKNNNNREIDLANIWQWKIAKLITEIKMLNYIGSAFI